MDPNNINPDEFKNLSKYLTDAAKGANTLQGIMKALRADGKEIVTHLREVSSTFDQIILSSDAFANLMKQQIAASNGFLANQMDIAAMQRDINQLEYDFIGLLGEGNAEAGYLAQEQLALFQLQAQGLGLSSSAAKEYAMQLARGVDPSKAIESNEVKILDAKEKQIEFLKKGLQLELETKKRVEELRDSHNKIRDTIKQQLMFAKEMAKDPRLLGAMLAKELVKYLGQAYQEMRRLMETGMQAGEAIRMMRENFSLMAVIGLSKVSGVSSELVSQFGTMNAMTKEQRHSIGEMAFLFGLAEKEAVDLTLAISRMPGESMATATNFKNTAQNVGKLTGVLPSQIMKEMAKNSSNIAIYSKGGAQGFAMAAAKAKLLGIEMSSILSAARKTLDFESSINDQLEASVLMGQELNFDKLRAASLSGDTNAIMEEQTAIMRQVGSLDNLNVLQKEKLAQAMGMTVEELTKFNAEQQFNNKYFGENAGLLDNAIGGFMLYGGAIGGAIAQHGTLILTLIQTGIQLVSMMAMRRMATTQMIQETTVTMTNTGAVITNTTTRQAATGAEAAGTVVRNGGIVSFVRQTASVIANTAATAANTVARWLGITATTAQATANGTLAASQTALAPASAAAAGGLGTFGTVLVALGQALAAPTPIGVPVIGILLMLGGVFLMMGASIALASIPIVMIAQVIGGVLMKALEMLPAIINAVVDGFVRIFSIMAENWQILIPVGVGMMAIGLGLLTMGAAAIYAFPGIFLMAFALGMITPSLLAIAAIGKMDGMTKISEGLKAISAAREGLGGVAMAVMSIAGGLGLMAMAGIAALPAIGALIGLAAVAPALTGLGNVIGGMFGGGEGKKEEKMDILIAKIDQLITVASQGGTVNLDGKKVGDVLRQSINSSGVR